MIFLALLYLGFFSGSWNTLALPTDSRTREILVKNHLQSIFICEEDKFDSQSIYGILWSCLSTIFACSWITVHPNMPALGDSQWAILRRRLAIMAYFLLTPEFVILWAVRQHFVACNLTKWHATKYLGWTWAHSFFLIKGGFMLHKRGKPVRVLEARDLEELLEAGKITWPTITKEEIVDRSKGDYLSKTIVLFQATWFVRQCIARGAYHLTVTELEVVTVAFASLTGVIYYLWWDKPLDVRCSIPVHLLPDRFRIIKGDIEKEYTGPQVIPSLEIPAKEIPEILTHTQQPQFKSIHPSLIQLPPEWSDFGLLEEVPAKNTGNYLGSHTYSLAFPWNDFSTLLATWRTARLWETKVFEYLHFIHSTMTTTPTRE